LLVCSFLEVCGVIELQTPLKYVENLFGRFAGGAHYEDSPKTIFVLPIAFT